MIYRLEYTVDGRRREFLETPGEYKVMVFLASILPSEFNSVANFGVMKAQCEKGHLKVKRKWLDGNDSVHCVEMKLEK